MIVGSLALLAVVLAAFTGLDGIGRGAVLRAVTGRCTRPRDEVFAGVGPQLLGSHVWLVAAVGLLVGVFGRWEIAVISYAYWWVLAIAAGLVLRVAALDFRRKGGRPVWELVSAIGALATGAGTGGFLATMAGVWPMAGAVAVVALDWLLGGWWLDGAPTPVAVPVAGAALLVPAVALAVDDAYPGALVVAAPAVGGTLLAHRVGRVHRADRGDRADRGVVGPGVDVRPTGAATSVVAGTALVLAAVATVVARFPELAVPGADPVPVTDLVAGPVAVTLVLAGSGPVLLLVLVVQAWFWRSLARRPAAVYY